MTWSGSEKQRVMSDIEIDGTDTVEQIEEKFDKKFKEVNNHIIDSSKLS